MADVGVDFLVLCCSEGYPGFIRVGLCGEGAEAEFLFIVGC